MPYLRDNPAGEHRELWYHEQGDRSWLVVTRNTLTHEISKVELARDVELQGDAANDARSDKGSKAMSQSNRVSGGLDRPGQAVAISISTASNYAGYEGDTLASALIANDVKLVGRSFKYHRPRGILTAGSEEPNALVELRTGAHQEPNTRATTVELFDGLEARSQNHRGPLKHDLMAINDLMSPFLAAGFYYKTFMWPKAFWEKLYEPVIRAAAGLGRLSGARRSRQL